MIALFNKLKIEGLLKEGGNLLDVGSGNGRASMPFFKYGYNTTLVDKDEVSLSQVENIFGEEKKADFKTIHSPIENFNIEDSYDGIIASHVLSFQKNKEAVREITNNLFNSLNRNGFLFFTLFGTNDEWATKNRNSMSFYTKDEALAIIADSPYFISEDYGEGSTMNGDIKTWHIFHLLYIKK